ncbi:EamA family transporter RarD [Nocardiopsis ansamitocini]|uniref:Protein RarD n=1 Tax=Nocardiopsis ansamitocini TaxID=1670832 RepID=A0A9W6P939_9ACTN|nr:EamA family transporter RarD [Nocardiopsis ansamitocini]GLU49243.1 protein RarD [Nocardiopsis ansamitocini]
MSELNKGVAYGVSAYLLWGIVPLYWPLVSPSGSLEILAQRMIWSLVVVLVVLAARRHWRWVLGVLRSPRQMLLLTLAAVLIALNWGVFIYAVNSGNTLQAALAYFINPLVSVSMGVLVFSERLRVTQWVAVALGGVAVVVLAVDYGSLPWMALTMALSFAFYGLVKKFVRLDGVESLTVETAVLFLPALAFAVFLEVDGTGTFLSISPAHSALLAGAGLVTAVPLMLFGSAAHRIPLSLVGLLQFIAPVLQFLVAWLIFNETMSPGRWIGFSIVWAALALFAVDMIRHTRPLKTAAVHTDPVPEEPAEITVERR